MLIMFLPMNIDQLPFEIAETAHTLRREFDRRAAPLGVTRAQWRALAWIGRQPGMRQVELADHLDIEPITLCRIVDRLEEAGLIERRRDPADRRAWLLHLTDKGEPLVRDLRGLAASMAGEVFDGIDPQAIALVRETLARIRENVADMAKGRLSA